MRVQRFLALLLVCVSLVVPLAGDAATSAFLNLTVKASPAAGLVPTPLDGYANWRVAGMNAVPFTASIAADGTMTVTATLGVTSGAPPVLGPGQRISGAGVWATISAARNDPSSNSLTGVGGTGTYTVSPVPLAAVSSEAMIATGIPNRCATNAASCVSATLSASGGDDTAAIQTAVNNCAAGKIVLLNTGVFHLTGDGFAFTSSGCTLRGSGAGQQLSTGLNQVGGGGTVRACTSGILTTYGDGSFCTDSTATQLVKSDRATVTNQNINVFSQGNNVYANSYNFASDVALGATSVTLTSTPPDVHVGDKVYIDQLTSSGTAPSDPNVNWGFFLAGRICCGETSNLIGYGMRRTNSSIADIMEVSAVSGATITFSTPFTYPYKSANNAQLTTYPNPWAHGIGVENLFVWGGNTNGNLTYGACAYCWAKGVEAAWSIDPNIGFVHTFKNVLRDSFIHETPNPTPGGAGYMLEVGGAASETLVENNIIWYGDKVNVMRAGGGGNVFGYNYTDDAFGSNFPDSPEAGMNAGHATTTRLTLFEGNYSHQFKGDTYWGNANYTTIFRNWFSGHRAAHPPLNTYTFNSGCLASYGDYNGAARAPIDAQAYAWNQAFIGNVLGYSGQVLLGGDGCFPAQQSFQVSQTTTAQRDAQQAVNAVVMWQFGNWQVSTNPIGSFTFTDCTGQGVQPDNQWTFDECTIQTQTRLRNWEWCCNSPTTVGAEHCYTYGTATDAGCTGVPAIPNSFYLASKPAFFGTQTWPWVDPTTGATYVLPGKYCFEHGHMPTCSIPAP